MTIETVSERMRGASAALVLEAIPLPWIAALPPIDRLPIFRSSLRCLHDLVCGTVVVRLIAR